VTGDGGYVIVTEQATVADGDRHVRREEDRGAVVTAGRQGERQTKEVHTHVRLARVAAAAFEAGRSGALILISKME
jgi:hypothetical protein